MELHHWVMLGLGVLGFVITWTGQVVGITRFAESIKQAIAAEVLARTKALNDAVEARNEEMERLRSEFAESQRTQDHNIGEMGSALRRYVETVEKEMHKIEIWGRDNYVQKGEFEKATESIRSAIKEMAAEIKADIKELNGKIDSRH